MNGNCLPYIMYLKIIFVSIDLKILSGHKVILNFFFLVSHSIISKDIRKFSKLVFPSS